MADIINVEFNRRKRHFATHNDLKREYEREGFRDTHQDISDFIYNQGGRFDSEAFDNPNSGERRDASILDSTSTLAHRALVAGLYSGITSPVNKWFRLTVQDKKLKESASVKEWFDQVTEIILNVLSNSNFYTTMESVYSEVAAFGTGAMQIESDVEDVLRFTPFTVGKYYIDSDDKGRVNWLSREIPMRARNIVEKFGIDKVSQRIKDAVAGEKTGSEWFTVLHVQEKNRDREAGKIDGKNKPWISVYYEKEEEKNHAALRVSGYEEKPFVAPRWSVSSGNVWGNGPAEMALGDTKELQELTELRLMALEKQIEPPLVANAKSADVAINTGPSAITWVDGETQGQGAVLSPAYQIDVNLANLEATIAKIQDRIRQVFYVDLLFALSAGNDPRETATAVIARQREQLRLMGPVIERMYPDLVHPTIDRVFGLLFRLGLFPEAPKEIEGLDIKVEIISLIAQAQKLTAVTPIEQLVASVADMSQFWPEVLKKINGLQVVDELSEAMGVPPGIIFPDELVAQMEAQEAAELEKQQELEEAQAIASSAKELSQTDLSGNNALTALAGGGQ